jgi:hypothetical protein
VQPFTIQFSWISDFHYDSMRISDAKLDPRGCGKKWNSNYYSSWRSVWHSRWRHAFHRAQCSIEIPNEALTWLSRAALSLQMHWRRAVPPEVFSVDLAQAGRIAAGLAVKFQDQFGATNGILRKSRGKMKAWSGVVIPSAGSASNYL